MGLFRLLILLALIATVYWLWRKYTRKAPPAPKGQSLPMVRCAQCGIHIPQDRALKQHERWYCSQAHLEQDKDGRAQ